MPPPREEKIKLEVTGAAQSERDLTRVGNAADKAGDQVQGMGRQADRAGDQVDDLGDEARAAARDLDALADQLNDTARAAIKAGVAYRDASGKLRDLQGRFLGAARAKQLLGGGASPGALLAGGSGGHSGGKGGGWFDALGDQVTEGLKKPFSASGGLLSGVASNPYGLAIGVTGAALAAPAIGATAGGAIGFGAAAGVVGGGLAGAWMGDPEKYGARWDEIIDHVKDRWLGSTRQFGGPLEDALDEVDRVFRDLPIERLASIGKNFVGPLVQGAGGGLTAVADGFADLVEKSQPFVDEVAPELVGLGNDIGDALRNIGLGAEGGGEALGDLINGIGYAIKATGVLIHGFEEMYQAEKDSINAALEMSQRIPVLGDSFSYLTDELFGVESSLMTAGKALDDTAVSTRGLVDVEKLLAESATEASNAIATQFGVMLSAEEATDRATEATLELNETLKKNGYELDGNSKKALENRDAVRDAIRAWEDEREAAIEAGKGSREAIDAANKKLLEHLEQLRATLKAHGENTDAVDAYIEELKIAMKLKLPDQHVTVWYEQKGLPKQAGNRYGGDDQHARGGVMTSTGVKLVGEEGPELIWGSQGQYVSTAAQTRALLSGGGSPVAVGAGGSAVAMPPDAVLRQAVAAIVSQLMQDGQLPVPATALV